MGRSPHATISIGATPTVIPYGKWLLGIILGIKLFLQKLFDIKLKCVNLVIKEQF